MFTKNMKVSMMPMSAWNCSGENTQVITPIASVMPVKMMLAPVTRMVFSNAWRTVSPARRYSCMRLQR